MTLKQSVSFIIDGLNDKTVQLSTRVGRYETPEDLYTQFLSLLPTTSKNTKHTPRNELEQFGLLSTDQDREGKNKRQSQSNGKERPFEKHSRTDNCEES